MKNGVFWDATPFGSIPEDTILHSHRRENLNSYISCNARALMCSSFMYTEALYLLSYSCSALVCTETLWRRFLILNLPID
jgi:hypothetical protein